MLNVGGSLPVLRRFGFEPVGRIKPPLTGQVIVCYKYDRLLLSTPGCWNVVT